MVIKGRKINQKLEERSKITFEFPGGETRVLPFFENIEISENKKANYARYQPLGRSSTMFSYVGSESRQLKIQFKITLPLIQQMVSRDLVLLTFPRNSANNGKLTPKDFKVDSSSEPTRYKIDKNDAASFEQEYLTTIDNVTSFELQESIERGKLSQQNKKIIDVVVYWINLIRSSVINNSVKVYQGPPIIRVTHGILFQDVPCLCMSYNIQPDEAGGYDPATLLPRVMNVDLDLSELRHGNFTNYRAGSPIERDNIVGWEAVITPDVNHAVTLDPLPIKG
jgi:hypothetical protein